MAIADKLTYLNATKVLLREAINRAGHYLTEADPFRSYPYALLKDEHSLSLDFLRGEYIAKNWRDGTVSRVGFDSIVTFTRGSGGGRFNHLGTFEWVGNNVARIDHDPATVDTSTSSVTIGAGLKTFDVSRLYPVGQYVRATADASNWLSGRVVASTGTSVTMWVDRVVGTGTFASWTLIRVMGLLVEESRTNLLLNSATLSTQSVTVTATSHTLAFYGTGTVTLSGAATGTLVGTGANNQVTLTFTPTAGSLTLTVSGSVTSAGLQAGAFITSHIPTTSSQVTRAADVASVNELSPWYRADEGTLFVEASTNNTTNGGFPNPATLSSDASNYISINHSGGNLLRAEIRSGGVLQALLSSAVTLGTPNKIAVAFKLNGFASSVNGGAVSTDTSGAVPSVSVLRLGSGPTGALILNGHVPRIRYFPRALTATELQRLTS